MPDPRFSFFGRSEELSQLRALLSAARGGVGRAALLVGPSGVGKKRLLSALYPEIQREEILLEGWCRAHDPRPHGPLISLLGEAARQLEARGHDPVQIVHALDLAAGLFDAGADHLHFQETLLQAFLELSRTCTAITLIHDAHLAAPALLKILETLLQDLFPDPVFHWAAAEPARGLFVFSFEERPNTAGLLEAARASTAIARVDVGGLEGEALEALLSSPPVRDRVAEITQGAPAALGHLIALLPRDMDELWSWRFGRLSADARDVLELLALLGTPCDVHRMRRLCDHEALKALLTELVEAGILNRTVEAGRVHFFFTDHLIHQACLDRIALARRARLHRQLAERLSGLPGVSPVLLAHHALEGELLRSAEVLSAVGLLESNMAFEAATGYLARLIKQHPSPSPEARQRLASLYTRCGQPGAARDVLLALDGAGGAQLARLHLEARDTQAALSLAREELERLADAGERGGDTRALLAIGAEATFREGNLGGVERYLPALGDEIIDEPRLEARNSLGKAHLYRERLDEAEAVFSTNLTEARQLKAAVHEGRALINLGIVHLQRGDPHQARGLFEAARRQSMAARAPHNLAIAEANLAVLHQRAQRFGQALFHHHNAAAAFRRLGQMANFVASILNLADLYFLLGDTARVARLLEIINEAELAPHIRPQRLALQGDLAQRRGDYERARASYDEAIAHIQAGGGSNQRLGRLYLSRAELALRAEDLEAAAAALAQAEQVDPPPSPGPLQRVRVELALARGRDEEALTLATPPTTDAAEVWRLEARMGAASWRLGRPEEALAHFRAAERGLERLAEGLPPPLKRAFMSVTEHMEVLQALSRLEAGLPPQPEPTPQAKVATERPFNPVWARRYPALIGRAEALTPVFNALDRVSGTDSMVLIRGESGTGKELVASAIHQNSLRAHKPFVRVNCAAFVEELLLSELFGHEQGAFTGAHALKRGRFELADGGTLFLDEIGDISAKTQVALLRVLQEGVFERVGGEESVRVDTRVLCATHRDLEQMVREGAFRQDLYYRLRGVVIEVPPLRARIVDLPLLIQHFLSRRPEAEAKPLRLGPSALASLTLHSWPGNIRELENLTRNVALFADGPVVEYVDLALTGERFPPPDEASLLKASEMLRGLHAPLPPVVGLHRPAEPVDEGAWLTTKLAAAGGLPKLKKLIEFEVIAMALREEAGNITKAAARLGMKRPRLSQIIHKDPSLTRIKEESQP